MIESGWRRFGLLAAVLFTAGCLAVTVNVTFPQEKIEGAASSIEDLVRMPKEAPDGSPKEAPGTAPGRKSQRLTVTAWTSLVGPTTAEAQVPDLKTRTPEVMRVIESRRARFGEVSAALARGCLGENRQGLVEVRPGTGCPPNLAAVAAAENQDRMALYRILVQQNNMPPGDIVRVQAAFAKTNREKAPGGAWVQTDGGQWVRK